MNDYIKREDAVTYIKEHQCLSCSDIGLCGNCAVFIELKLLEKVPAADVRENVRGHWIVKEDAWITSYKCSACGTTWSLDLCDDRFCSHCGADMRGEG